MAEMHVEAKLEERDGKRLLMIDGQEVAVAYYRSAYTPVDYPTEQEWLGRELIERSYAIKCHQSRITSQAPRKYSRR
ncbi:hypothetical protein PINS_up022182 [Pythium insidiosum]|nr:hypothetical protein PINS_up022182 [Pythium insidiosum]